MKSLMGTEIHPETGRLFLSIYSKWLFLSETLRKISRVCHRSSLTSRGRAHTLATRSVRYCCNQPGPKISYHQLDSPM